MTHKEFYKTRAWTRCRGAFIATRVAIDGGMCQVCGAAPGLIVHHVVWLNDTNCNDPGIALNPDNLRYECQTCHNQERDPLKQRAGRYVFDSTGELISTEATTVKTDQ